MNAVSLVPPKPSPLVPGYRLDRYELLCPIAEGGMASVWVARLKGKHGFEKLVAIKTILPKYASDHRFQQMFLDEARIASGIEHANVAQILDLGEEHDVLYLVMEWVDGDALSKLHRAVEKKGMSIPHGIALRILADTCGGLHVAHELRDPTGSLLGVVHRDVSPQNVLVSARGAAKLIDFGIAKARDRVAGDTNTGFLKGKIQYMAPEQALGKSIDRRADVWAIGSILYHLLAGKPPYEGANQLATLHMLTSGKPPLPLPSSVPAAVTAVVRRALTHDPEKRIESAAALQIALEHAMVEAKISTTAADVAAFTKEHLADRAAARKAAVEMALAAAQERVRMVQLLKPTSADSSAGFSSLGASSPGLSATGGNPASVPSAGVPARPVSSANIDAALRDEPISETSSATLGSAAALDSPLPPVDTRRRKWLYAGGATAVIALAVVISATVMRAGHVVDAGASTLLPSAPAVAAPTTARDTAPESSLDPALAAPLASGVTPQGSSVPEVAPSTSTSAQPPTRPKSFGAPTAKAHPAMTATPPATTTTTKPAASPPKKKTVDDGF
jgi:serine/threonine protein kinase